MVPTVDDAPALSRAMEELIGAVGFDSSTCCARDHSGFCHPFRKRQNPSFPVFVAVRLQDGCDSVVLIVLLSSIVRSANKVLYHARV